MDPDVEKGLLADLIARIVIAIGVIVFVVAFFYRVFGEVQPYVENGLALVFGLTLLSFKERL